MAKLFLSTTSNFYLIRNTMSNPARNTVSNKNLILGYTAKDYFAFHLNYFTYPG